MNEKLEVIYDIWENVSFAAAGCACTVIEGGAVDVYKSLVVIRETKSIR